MTAGAAPTLEQETRGMFARLDAMDLDGLDEMFDQDIQAVDELTRSWMRGRAILSAYFTQLEDMVSEVRTELRDVHEQVSGEISVLTFILDQTYSAAGERHALTAPTSVVGRRDGAGWKILLFHSVPLPEEG
jgi:ketosteroid isomerase-like protein